jgi:hypothetical protein
VSIRCRVDVTSAPVCRTERDVEQLAWIVGLIPLDARCA